MNRHTLQKIILEELSSERHVRPRRRALGLVDYLYESSDQNLLKIREVDALPDVSDDDVPVSVNDDDPNPIVRPPVEPPRGGEPGSPPVAAAVEPLVAGPPAPTAVAAPDAAPGPSSTDTDNDIDKRPRAKGKDGGNGTDTQGDPEDDSAGLADVSPTSTSLSDMIDNSIDAAARAGSGDTLPAEASPREIAAAAPVAEGAYWRRGLVDLLYSN
jgi:hypothetical protein